MAKGTLKSPAKDLLGLVPTSTSPKGGVIPLKGGDLKGLPLHIGVTISGAEATLLNDVEGALQNK